MDDISINLAYHEQLKAKALKSKMRWQFHHFSYFLMILYEKEDLFALSALTLSNIPWVFAADLISDSCNLDEEKESKSWCKGIMTTGSQLNKRRDLVETLEQIALGRYLESSCSHIRPQRLQA